MTPQEWKSESGSGWEKKATVNRIAFTKQDASELCLDVDSLPPTTTTPTPLTLRSQHYNKGGLRVVHQCQLSSSSTPHVIKFFMKKVSRPLDDALCILKQYAIAQSIAEEFTTTLKSKGGAKYASLSFSFLPMQVLEYPDTFKPNPYNALLNKYPGYTSHSPDKRFVGMAEPLVSHLPFRKWLCNDSEVGSDDCPLAHAFAHFSLSTCSKYLKPPACGGCFVVTDIQGWKDEGKNEYRLTDPAFQTEGLRVSQGMTDLANGVTLFREKHKCNAVCGLLNLKPVKK